MKDQRVRHSQRPQRDEIRYWNYKEQEWLTLGEMSYRSMQRAVRHAIADTREEEQSASQASELAYKSSWREYYLVVNIARWKSEGRIQFLAIHPSRIISANLRLDACLD